MRLYPLPKNLTPISYCSDRLVQHFVEHEISLFTPYSFPSTTMTARQVFEAARRAYGDWRCWDLVINLH